MGCSIHAFIEVMPRDAEKAKFFAKLGLTRDYDLFAILADVRNPTKRNSWIPVSKPKGLPENLNWEIEDERVERSGDYHSYSWLSIEELQEVQKRYAVLKTAGKEHRSTNYEDVSRQLNGLIDMMKALKTEEEEPRLVFWFDN